jgi:hypothetical protein
MIVARDQVLTKADGIRDVAGRERFVTTIVDHARTLELAARVGL